VQVTHPDEASASGCLLEIRQNAEGEHPPRINHLQLEEITTRRLASVLRQSAGQIGRTDTHDITEL